MRARDGGPHGEFREAPSVTGPGREGEIASADGAGGVGGVSAADRTGGACDTGGDHTG